jgi:hypothetical protein
MIFLNESIAGDLVERLDILPGQSTTRTDLFLSEQKRSATEQTAYKSPEVTAAVVAFRVTGRIITLVGRVQFLNISLGYSFRMTR